MKHKLSSRKRTAKHGVVLLAIETISDLTITHMCTIHRISTGASTTKAAIACTIVIQLKCKSQSTIASGITITQQISDITGVIIS